MLFGSCFEKNSITDEYEKMGPRDTVPVAGKLILSPRRGTACPLPTAKTEMTRKSSQS